MKTQHCKQCKRTSDTIFFKNNLCGFCEQTIPAKFIDKDGVFKVELMIKAYCDLENAHRAKCEELATIKKSAPEHGIKFWQFVEIVIKRRFAIVDGFLDGDNTMIICPDDGPPMKWDGNKFFVLGQ